jgi:uncharacterized protein (DUF2267 family)
MSLHEYTWPRLVVLAPNRSALEAARALENNNIGAIVVQHEREVIGIVTDRDLAVRVVGQGRDPRETRLADVMTRSVSTLTPDASRMEAIQLMRSHRIRRIPLVDETNAIVGVVTLDDLLADEAAPSSELAAVVRAQVGEGGPSAPTRLDQRAAERRESRLDSTRRRFLNHFRAESGLESAEQAETACLAVLSPLLRRLTPEEAMDLIAQLPLKIAEALRGLPPGPDKDITRDTMTAALVTELGVSQARAEELVAAFARTLDENVSAGQMDDIRQQLPAELRDAFTPAVTRR